MNVEVTESQAKLILACLSYEDCPGGSCLDKELADKFGMDPYSDSYEWRNAEQQAEYNRRQIAEREKWAAEASERSRLRNIRDAEERRLYPGYFAVHKTPRSAYADPNNYR